MENGNPTNPTAAAAPSKFCTACGAQLHMQAEICPKCGVRQAPLPNAAPQGPQTNTSAGTASRKSGGGKGCLIACGVVLALLVLGFVLGVGPLLSGGDRMRAFNDSAVSLLRNVATVQEVLYMDYGVYGSSRHGKLPGPGGVEPQILFGPLPAATANSEGAMISATGKDGKPVAYGIEVEAGVALLAAGAKEYGIFTKHNQSNRVYFQDEGVIYYCENNAWIGLNDFNKIGHAPGKGIVGTPCGGSPVSTWQKL